MLYGLEFPVLHNLVASSIFYFALNGPCSCFLFHIFCVKDNNDPCFKITISFLIFSILASNEKGNERTYVSKADFRKNMRRLRNGPGRNQSLGGRVENSKGFSPNSFDRVLLDAPCSALGLRPRLFAGEVQQST